MLDDFLPLGRARAAGRLQLQSLGRSPGATRATGKKRATQQVRLDSSLILCPVTEGTPALVGRPHRREFLLAERPVDALDAVAGHGKLRLLRRHAFVGALDWSGRCTRVFADSRVYPRRMRESSPVPFSYAQIPRV